MADIAVPVIVALLAALGLAGSVLRRRLTRRRPAPSPPAATTNGERQERLLQTAFRAGDVPPVWYRHQMAVIAADDAHREPRV